MALSRDAGEIPPAGYCLSFLPKPGPTAKSGRRRDHDTDV